MISKQTIEIVSHMFCGDIEGSYKYKTGSELVSFFNSNFGFSDKYGQGFPSRWIYVYDKLVEFLNKGKFEEFINLILSYKFVMKEFDIQRVEAVEHINTLYDEFIKVFNRDSYLLIKRDGKYYLTAEDVDLVLIGVGGYANVYKQKSTGLVIKRLKDDFLMDEGIRSRFKREFNIMQTLQDVQRTYRNKNENGYLG